jgi:hypothetical protein
MILSPGPVLEEIMVASLFGKKKKNNNNNNNNN